MSEAEREQRTTYHACKHGVSAVDDKLSRKGSLPFRDALEMERQSYVDLANKIAKALSLPELV